MKPTINELRKIAETLPIGYYAKRKVSVEFSEEADTSYYNPENDTITFAYNNILAALENVEDMKQETAVRSVLYHELSHAILTPQVLPINDIVNIFEDERIETLLADFYMGVDFKENIKAITGYNGEAPTNAREAFFYTVRFRSGNPVYVQKVKYIIMQYALLGHSSPADWNIRRYYQAIKDLWDDINNDYLSHPERYQNNSFPQNENTSSNFDKDNWFSMARQAGYSTEEAEELFDELIKHFNQNDESADEEETESGENEENENNEAKELSPTHYGFGEKVFKTFFNASINTSLTEKLAQIINAFNKKNSSGNGMTSYSGVLNPRLCGRDSYKFFERKSEARGNNRFGSFHLNLFIDVSGSFCDNKDATNTLIRSLADIERKNPNFTFDVVHCGIGQQIRKKGERFIDPDGGNCFDRHIKEQFLSLQKHNTYNYNIFLFDGWCNPERGAFASVDFNNCTIISDLGNKCELAGVKKAKIIYSDRYVQDLYENVFVTLKRAFR